MEKIFNAYNDSDIFASLTNQDKYFFVDTHIHTIEDIRKIWPRATIIMFNEQFSNFRDWRLARINNKKRSTHWNIIRGADWPELPPTDISELSANIQDELATKFPYFLQLANDDINHYIQIDDKITFSHDLIIDDNIILWQANNYLIEDKFIVAMEQLYQQLNLSDFNYDYMIRIYRAWIKALDRSLDIPLDRLILDK